MLTFVTAAPILDRLVALREQAGLTQSEVAARMGTSQPVIARLEAGGRDPRLSTIERYARTIGADLEVRPSTTASPRTAARLAERIYGRLDGGEVSPTTTFREVVQFLDDLGGMTAKQARAAVRQEPLSTGDRRWDALIAAAVDWVAGLHGFTAPRWTRSSRRSVPAPGWVVSPHKRLHALVRKSTPIEFARHGVYVDEASLRST